MLLVDTPTQGDFQRGVDTFLASLSWVYFTNRYCVAPQGELLRVLTLSGLDPSWWDRCAMRLLLWPDGHLVQMLAAAAAGVTEEQLAQQRKRVVAEIHAYAVQVGASVGEPPRFPLYLVGYGYTQEDYLADLCDIYGYRKAQAYRTPWPLAVKAPFPESPRQRTIFHRSYEMMGVTAGAIERLLALGGGHGLKP
jgi:hypothetical protein